MTDAQLSILLVSIKKSLDAAILAADESIVNEDRHKKERYIGNSPFPSIATIGKKNPEDWGEYEGNVIALDVIRAESESLQGHIDSLALQKP